MHANAVDRRRQDLAASRDNPPRGQHGRDMGEASCPASCSTAPRLCAWRERRVVLIGPVGENLRGDPQAQRGAGLGELRQRRGKQDQILVIGANRLRHRRASAASRQASLLSAPCGLTWVTRPPWARRKAVEGADLVEHQRLDLFARAAQRAAAKTLEVGIGGMRADADAAASARATVPRMVTGSPAWKPQARLADCTSSQQGLVVAHAPGAKTFAEVGVEVDFWRAVMGTRRRALALET